MRFLLAVILLLTLACSYQFKVKTGDQAVEVKQYAIAAGLYYKEFQNSSREAEKASIAYKLGVCNNALSDYSQALKWFKIAYELNYGPSALLNYAKALKSTGDYELAIEAFEQLIKETRLNSEYSKEINSCKILLGWRNESKNYNYKIKRLDQLSDNSSDYNYNIIKDGIQLLVTEGKFPGKYSDGTFKWTGRSYSDIVIYDGYTYASFSDNINSKFNEGAYCFNSDYSSIFFTRCMPVESDKDYCSILKSDFINGQWSEPEILDFGLDNCNTMHPALHPNDSLLIFASDVKGGAGKMDLFSSLLVNGEWSVAKALSGTINTSEDEVFPIWKADTLYFSSKGHLGLGGLDIFSTYRDSEWNWLPPKNLKNPVNSEADDFSPFFVSPNAQDTNLVSEIYVSSNRETNYNDDIFKIELRKVNSTPSKKELPEYKLEIYAHIQFVNHETYDLQDKVILEGINLVDVKSNFSFSTGSNQTLKLKLRPSDTLYFKCNKEGYLNSEFRIVSPPEPLLTSDSTIILNIEVELLQHAFDKEFVIKSLYYDFDKWDIRPDAEPALKELLLILRNNPEISILIGSHTDCRGDDKYNLELSEKRAKSAIDWLVLKGIEKSRLLHRGYGEENPAVNCECTLCTETEHQNNRRSTFKIIP